MPRIATYNIHHARGTDGIVLIDRIAETLSVVNADLVALQEVDRFRLRSGFKYQAWHLARLLRCRWWCYGVNREYYLIGAYGNAIYSRFPIARWCNLPLPSLKEQRGLLSAEIDIRGLTVWFGCVHLGLSRDERADHVQRIVEHLDTVTHPMILAGDFNCAPDAPELAPLLAVLRNTLDDPSAAPTYPSSDPRVRLDNILVSPRFRVEDARNFQCQASDHLPLYADIRMDGLSPSVRSYS